MVIRVPYTGAEKESHQGQPGPAPRRGAVEAGGPGRRRPAPPWSPPGPACSAWSSTWRRSSTAGSATPSAARPSRCRSMTTTRRPTCASSPRRPPTEILAFYGRARAAADQVIAELRGGGHRHRLVRRGGHDALGPDPHDRGDGPPRRPRRHPPRADRRHGRRPPTWLALAYDRPTAPCPDLRGRPAGATALQHPLTPPCLHPLPLHPRGGAGHPHRLGQHGHRDHRPHGRRHGRAGRSRRAPPVPAGRRPGRGGPAGQALPGPGDRAALHHRPRADRGRGRRRGQARGRDRPGGGRPRAPAGRHPHRPRHARRTPATPSPRP